MDAAELAAIEAIRRLKARYFRHMDQKDWESWREVFADDLSAWTPDDTGGAPPTVGRDVFVDSVRSFIDDVVTAHHGHMSEIELDGDSASGVWSMEDNLWWPPDAGLGHLWGLGWYEERYRRGADGTWRIAELHLRRIRVEVDGVQVFPAVAA